MTSLKLCIESLAGVSNSPVPVEVCIEQLTSAESNKFVVEESEAEQLLDSLVDVITQAVNAGNSPVVRACLHFLGKANKNNAWLMASTKRAITHIVDLAVRVVAGTGLVLEKDLSENDIFPGDSSNPFTDDAVCCEVAECFLELILDYFDVDESQMVENQLRVMCVLSALILFRPSKNFERNEEENWEVYYSMDCLDRSASLLLCNGAEFFPELLDKLRLILRNSKHDLLKLICEATELGIQRGLVHFCVILYHHKNAQNRFVFSDLRQNLRSSLRSKPEVYRRFQAIADVSNDYSVEKIDAFCEAINDTRSHFFVAKGCRVSRTNERGADACFLGVCDIHIDVLSFAVCLPDQDKQRIPYFAATNLIIDELDSTILIRDSRNSSHGLRVQFSSSLTDEGSIGWKVVQCLKKHLHVPDPVDLLNSENMFNRKVSVAMSPSDELNVKPVVLVSGDNFRPGSKRVNGISPAEFRDDVAMKPVENVVSDDSTNPDEAKTMNRCNDEDEQDEGDSPWIYNPPNSDSDDFEVALSQPSASERHLASHGDLETNDSEESSDEDEYFERIGTLVQQLLKKRAEKSRSIIRKHRSQVARMKAVRDEKQRERETLFMDMVKEECNKQSEELQKLGCDIVEDVQNQLNMFISQQKNIVVDKKRLTNKVCEAKTMTTGNGKKLEKELAAAYETNIQQKKKTAEEMSGLFKGIQQLFDS